MRRNHHRRSLNGSLLGLDADPVLAQVFDDRFVVNELSQDGQRLAAGFLPRQRNGVRSRRRDCAGPFRVCFLDGKVALIALLIGNGNDKLTSKSNYPIQLASRRAHIRAIARRVIATLPNSGVYQTIRLRDINSSFHIRNSICGRFGWRQ